MKLRHTNDKERERCREYLTKIVGEDILDGRLKLHPFLNDVIIVDIDLFNNIAQANRVTLIKDSKKLGLNFSFELQESEFSYWGVYLDVTKRNEFIVKYGGSYTIE